MSHKKKLLQSNACHFLKNKFVFQRWWWKVEREFFLFTFSAFLYFDNYDNRTFSKPKHNWIILTWLATVCLVMLGRINGKKSVIIQIHFKTTVSRLAADQLSSYNPSQFLKRSISCEKVPHLGFRILKSWIFFSSQENVERTCVHYKLMKCNKSVD